MAEITAARLAVADARAAREFALRAMHTAEANADFWREPDGSFPVIDPNVPGNREPFEAVQALQPALDAASVVLAAASAAYDEAVLRYATLAVGEPLFPSDNLDPVLLLPVRLEAVYGENELKIRVYPDDVHVDRHEHALTDGEQLAGTTYWREIFAAGADARRHEAAWLALAGATGGERATWVREALTPTNQPPGVPVFPDVERRPEAWTRAAHTLLLPDHFEFSAYRDGTLVWRTAGAPIPDTLPLGIAPQSADVEADGLPFDPASRWLVDFEKAVAVGMGLVAPLSDPAERFDVLTAVGVGSQDAATGAARVEGALAAHAYSGGLSLLPVFTPTNNTPGSRSGWRSRHTPTPPEVVAERQAGFDQASPQNAARLARALGVDGRSVLAAASDPADDDEALLEKLQLLQADSFAWSMVWRSSKEVNRPGIGPTTQPWYAEASAHFSAYVRGRGPLPLVRIGRQPYGVLPVSSLELWSPADADDRIAWFVGSFQRAFAEHLDRAVQVGEAADQDAVLLDLLSREASPRRLGRWPYFVSGMDRTPPPAAVGAVPPTLALAWQHAREAPPADEPTPEPDWLEPFPSLLPAELRAFLAARPLAQLLVLFDEAIGRMRQTHVAPVPAEFEEQYFPIARTLWQLHHAPTNSLYYQQAEWAYNAIFNTLSSGPVLPDAVDKAVADAQALRKLFASYVDLEDEAVADLPRLERLFRQTLEPLASRIDAWVTSLSTRRLTELRAERPGGIRTGAYGWLENVEPTDPNPPREGYLVTPSLHHATTAAVLRSGWQAHSDKGAFAVDIQSARVRRALAAVEGVRAGQTIGALLGYQFERALHDAHLDRFIRGFRAAYPLAPLVEPAAADQQEARVSIGARNVVDGQALRRDRRRLEQDLGALAAAAGTEVGGDGPALLRIAAELDETFDAVGDLLLAESVHQLVGGSPLRAGLAADAIGRGQQLPTEYDVLRTPRSGIAVTHQVGVLLPEVLPAGWADDRPLVRLEPGLEGWIRNRLGPASRWQLDGMAWCALDLLVRPPETVRAEVPALDDAVFDRLMKLCERLRAAVCAAVPLSVTHLDPAAASPSSGCDLGELDQRVRPWLAEVKQAATNPAAEDAMDRLASLGIPVGAGGDPEKVRALLADTSLEPPPAPPDPEADAAAADAWLAAVLATTAALLHPSVILVPRLTADLPPSPQPVPGTDEIGDWLCDLSHVRPMVEALDGALVASEVFGAGTRAEFVVVQPEGPSGAATAWSAIAAPVESPHTQTSVVLQADDGSRSRGLVVDSWTEVVPRAAGTHGPEEVVGVTFDFDRPGARAPQAMLIAVPPDLARGWCREDLHACVEETLRLARLRTLDLADVPEVGSVLPIPQE